MRIVTIALSGSLLLAAAGLAHAVPPTCAITVPADGSGVGSAGVAVCGTAADDGAVACVVVRVNGSAWWFASGADQWTTLAPLAPGANHIEARARDNAGLWGPIVGITVNAVGPLTPSVLITSPPEGATVRDAATPVAGLAWDDVRVTRVNLRVNGGAWVTAAGTTNWSAWITLAPGANLIEARARDDTGQWGPIAVRHVTGATDLKPVVRFISPPDGSTLDGAAVLVIGTAHDDVAVAQVRLRVNGGPWFIAEGTTSWRAWIALQAGASLIEARARDSGEQWGPIVALQVWVSSELRPVVGFTEPTDGATVHAGSIPVSGVAFDDLGVSLVRLRVNAGAWFTASGTTTWSAAASLHLGANLIEARARDRLGQWGPIAAITVNRVDPLPTVVILSPAEGAIVPHVQVPVSGAASDNTSVTQVNVRANGGPWSIATGTTDWSAPALVGPGTNLVEARARDGLGQWGPIAAVSFFGAADLKPVVEFTDPPEGATVTSPDVLITGTAVDDVGLSKVIVRVNGGPWTDAAGVASWSATVTVLTGTNLIEARARDGAGQWGPIAALHLYGSGFADVPRFHCRPSAAELISPGSVTLIFEALVPEGTPSVEYAATLEGASPASVTVLAQAFVPVPGQEMVGANAQVELSLPEGLNGEGILTGTASCESGGEGFGGEWHFPVTIEALEPVPAREFRAAWTHSFAIDDAEDLFARLEASGLNAAIMGVRRGETARYNSALGPVSEVPFGNETLIEDCVAAAGRHGIDLHACVGNLVLASPDSEYCQQLLAQGRWQKNAAGEDVPWLCPSSPENLEFVEAAMVELARDYDLAGVQYDFIRYVGPDACFCDRCRAGFEALMGRTVDWPAECLAEGPVRAQWLDYRAGLITEIVRRTCAAIRAVNGSLVISAAIYSLTPEVAKQRLGQDYETWCREGYLDAVCPMAYTLDNAEFEERVSRVIAAVGGILAVYPGIGLRSGKGDMLYPEQFAAQLNIVRRLGAPGFAAYSVTPPTDAPETVLIPLRDTALAGDGRG